VAAFGCDEIPTIPTIALIDYFIQRSTGDDASCGGFFYCSVVHARATGGLGQKTRLLALST
jgi:hypothetical protein